MSADYPMTILVIASGCCAAASAVQALGEALKLNSTVTVFDLNLNRIGDEGAKARFGCQWSLVMASDCCTPGAAVQALGDAFKQNNTVTTISLETPASVMRVLRSARVSVESIVLIAP